MDVYLGERFMYGGHMYMIVPMSARSTYITYLYEVDGETVFADTENPYCHQYFYDLGWTGEEIEQGYREDWAVLASELYPEG